MLKKQKLVCLLAGIILLGGCATGNMRLAPKGVSGLPPAMARFEETKGLFCSELPALYDISHLKAGSSVKMKLTFEEGRPSDATMTLLEIKDAGMQKRYRVEVTSDRTRYVLDGGPSAFNRVICSDDFKIDSYYVKGDDNVWVALVGSFVSCRAAGVLYELIRRACDREPPEGREVPSMKDASIETKIIDFKFLADETLNISGRPVPCKVYAVKTISREVFAPLAHAAASTAIVEETKKVWISDEVPFGLVKSEGKKTMNMEVPGMGFLTMGQSMREACDVEEFHY